MLKYLETGGINVRTYGIDITQATLQEYALSKGIQTKVASMSQAEKAMLRFEYVTERLAFVNDDYARTMDTWANSTRRLAQQFEQLGSTIGTALIGAFKPLIQAMNSIMQRVISFVKTIVDALGVIFGWKMEISAGGAGDLGAIESLADTMDDVAGAAGDTSKGLGGAGKSAKDLKKTLSLLPFDQLNQLAKDTEKSGGGGGGSGSGGGGAGAGDGLDYSITQKETIFDKYSSDIKNLYQLGSAISDALTSAMNGIDWRSVYSAANHFGQGLADFLNGLISPELFGALGRTIANSLNTVLYAALSFGRHFDWTDLGVSISTGINEAFYSFDFENFGRAINVFANGIMDMIIVALNTLDADKIGDSIGTVMDKVDILTLAAKAGRILLLVFDRAFTSLVGSLKVAPLETALLGAFALINFTPLGGILAMGITKAFGFVVKDIAVTIGAALTSYITAALGVESLAGAFTALAGPVAIVVGVIGGLTAALLICWNNSESFRKVITNIATTIKEKVVANITRLQDKFKSLKDAIGKLVTNKSLVGFVSLLYELVGAIGGTALVGAIGVFTTALGVVVDVVTGVITALGGLFTAIDGLLHGDFEKVAKGFLEIGDGIVNGLLGGLANGVMQIIRTVVDIGQTIISSLASIVTSGEILEIGKNIVVKIAEGIISALPSVFSSALGIGSFIVENIGDATTWLVQKGSDAIEGLKTGFENAKTSFLSKGLSGLKDDIFSKIGDIKGKVKTKGSDIIDGIKSGYEAVKQSRLFSILSNFKSDAYSKLGDVKDKVKTKGSDIIEGIRSGYDSVKDSKLFAEVSKVKATIVSKIGDISSAVKSKGSDIITGMKNGFSANISSLTSAVSGLGSRVSSAMPNFYNIGYNAIKSFINGFKSLHIPTPHFNIGSETKSVLGISIKVPKFNGISWYAKGGILLNPQIFGYGNGSLLGGGEAGKEAMLPLENRRSMSMIADAITDNMPMANSDLIASAVERGVVTAMMNNNANQGDTILYAELKTEDNEVLARAVAKGKKSLEYRSGYAY